MTASDRYIKIAAILGLAPHRRSWLGGSWLGWPRSHLRRYLWRHGLAAAHCRTYYSIQYHHFVAYPTRCTCLTSGDLDYQGAYHHHGTRHTTNLLQAMTQNLA